MLLHPDRNGYLYVIDRATGEVLSADPFAPITTSTGVDLQTGALTLQPGEGAARRRGGARHLPGVARRARTGSRRPGRRAPGCSTSRTRTCARTPTTYQVSYIAGTPYVGADVKMYAGPGGHRGEFTAWDPVARKKAWALKENFPVWSGALATAGDVVFYGTMDGWFKAVDAKTGTLLWQFKTDSGIIGQPISYRGPDGKQYVAVLVGRRRLGRRDRRAATRYARRARPAAASSTR